MPTTAPIQKANAVVPAKVHGLGLLPSGQLVWNTSTYSEEVGFFNFELSGGARLFKPPGTGQDLVFVLGNKKKAARFVPGQGWLDTSHLLPSEWTRVALPGRRLRRTWGNLLGALGDRVRWLPVSEGSNPYRGLVDLMDDGRVGVAGTVYGVGQMFAEVALPNGWFVLRPNPAAVMIRDDHGVRERFRYGSGWSRLVSLESLEPNATRWGACLASDGSVVFRGALGPEIRVESGVPFVVYLSERWCVSRAARDHRVFRRDNGQVSEVIFAEGRWWSVSGARDEWSWSQVGCPGPNDRWSLPAMPGVTLHANGSVEVLGAAYLEGQPIDLVSGGTRIERAPGLFQPLYVASAHMTVGFVKQSDGEWWKGLATAPDPSRSSVLGVLTSRSLIALLADFINARIAEAPGLSVLLSVLLFLNRQMDGIRAHAGIFLGYEAILLMMLAWMGMGLYLLLVGLSLTYGAAYWVIRHLVRSLMER